MRISSSLLPSLLVILLLVQPAASQTEVLYSFSLELKQSPETGNLGDPMRATFLYHDNSRDSVGGLVPGAPGTTVLGHSIKWRVEPLGNNTEGWSIATPIQPYNSAPGETYAVDLIAIAQPTVKTTHVTARLIGTISTPDGGTYQVEALAVYFTTGLPGFAVNTLSTPSLAAREIGTASFEIINGRTTARSFRFDVTSNECQVGVAPPAALTLRGKERRVITVGLQAPADTFIIQKRCGVSLNVAPEDNLDAGQIVPLAINVQPSLYVDPWLTFEVGLVLLLVVLLILFLRRRKEKLEEEILGKPQKPWTIPVERVYLKHLKQKDERAWYVVRHFLMEEEYKSALLWYKAYKKGTKGARKKERLVLVEEKAYDKWAAAWRKAIAKPLLKADKHDAKLQRKLDKKAKKALRKEAKRWRRLTSRLTATAAKANARADERHAKLTKKAQKRGEPIPRAPNAEVPQLPPEPQLKPVLLADHKWSKRSARFRRRMEKRQGNLEVRFERADARRLRKLERKVRKIARRLDDPSFIEEHPLLRRALAPRAPPARAKAGKA